MSKGLHTFYWHDYETWGEEPASDKPSQFAGIRTDAELNVIGEPLMLYCQPPEDRWPKPGACLVTGLTPQYALEHGVKEVDFFARIHAELAQAGTCGVGYNSIRFDDEVTRYGLYRNFYDPYEREWKNGNSRWDIIDVARMTRAFRPEGIEWPDYDDGTPCFKLERLTQANGLEHGSAHDALSDVYATIALARLIKRRQPKLFDFALRLRSKHHAARLIDIDGLKPVLHVSSRFPSSQGNCALMLPLAYHPQNKNSVIAYNLSSDPAALMSEAPEVLAERLFVPSDQLPEGVERLPLKEIHLNKSPMVLPISMLDEALEQRLGLNRAVCERHWRLFRDLSLVELTALKSKLGKLYQLTNFAPRTDPETRLYDGFFDDHDRALMRSVRNSTGEDLAQGRFDFHDDRLPELLWRYRARNFPETLSESERRRWREFCRARLTESEPSGGWGEQDYVRELESLSAEPQSEANGHILRQLQQWHERLLREG